VKWAAFREKLPSRKAKVTFLFLTRSQALDPQTHTTFLFSTTNCFGPLIMDDALERPSHEVDLPVTDQSGERDAEGPASDDEDGGPDWTKLMYEHAMKLNRVWD
jgi:hypothetical protein